MAFECRLLGVVRLSIFGRFVFLESAISGRFVWDFSEIWICGLYLVKTDSIDMASKKSLKRHKYKVEGDVSVEMLTSCFEGDADDVEVTAMVHKFTGESSFRITVLPNNHGVRLRRCSDQELPRQCARVWVDGQEAGVWYLADSNPYKRWIEDEFEIPESLTRDKSVLNIRIVPESREEGCPVSWNEAAYEVFCYME